MVQLWLYLLPLPGETGASLWYRWRPTEEVYQRPEGPSSAEGGCRARSSDDEQKLEVLV